MNRVLCAGDSCVIDTVFTRTASPPGHLQLTFNFSFLHNERFIRLGRKNCQNIAVLGMLWHVHITATFEMHMDWDVAWCCESVWTTWSDASTLSTESIELIKRSYNMFFTKQMAAGNLALMPQWNDPSIEKLSTRMRHLIAATFGTDVDVDTKVVAP